MILVIRFPKFWRIQVNWSPYRLAALGILAVICVQVGQDLMQWTNWSNTFQPASIGRLLFIIGGAIGGWQAGQAGNQPQLKSGDLNVMMEAIRAELAKDREANEPHVILPLNNPPDTKG